MVTITVEEQGVRELLKQAILELLEERQDLFHELLTEAIEDLASSMRLRKVRLRQM